MTTIQSLKSILQISWQQCF